MKVEYSSNNSGGRWWLSDENWKDLEKAGWWVKWGSSYFCHSKYSFKDKPEGKPEPCESSDKCPGHRRFDSAEEMTEKDRWLGCLAKSATREGLSLRQAVAEWEDVTGMSSTDAGCPCCGTPHSFTEYDDEGKYVRSGPEAEYSASW